MGSHCSPRLDTSRYLFNTDISFLEKNNRRDIWFELNFRNRHTEWNWWGGGGGGYTTQIMRGEKCIISEVPQVGKLKQLNFLTFREHKNRQGKTTKTNIILQRYWCYANVRQFYFTWDAWSKPKTHTEHDELCIFINISVCQSSWGDVGGRQFKLSLWPTPNLLYSFKWHYFDRWQYEHMQMKTHAEAETSASVSIKGQQGIIHELI